MILLLISVMGLLGFGISSAAASASIDLPYQAAGVIADFTERPTCSLRLMPLGDSITKGGIGSSSEAGYRRGLWQALDSAGYDVDFVGRLESGLADDFDRDHEGHDGQSAGWMNSGNVLSDILTANPPDVILLHIGTNDISASWTAASTAAAIEGMLVKIDGFELGSNRPIMVILAQIINRQGSAEQISATSALNALIGELAAQRIASGDELILVDMEHALNYPDDLHDWAHPNDGGYNKMTGTWLQALETYLPRFCTRPTTKYQYIPLIAIAIR